MSAAVPKCGALALCILRYVKTCAGAGQASQEEVQSIFEQFFGGGGRSPFGAEFDMRSGRQRRRGGDIHVAMQCAQPPCRCWMHVYRALVLLMQAALALRCISS